MRHLPQIIAIVVVLGLALAATAWFLRHPREAQRADPPRSVPHVRAIEVHPQDFNVIVRTQGTVEPRLITSLVADVAGRIIEVAPRWENGAFFEEGDLLIQVDPSDYELAAVALEAEVAQAELRLAREREEAKSARSEWERLGSPGEPSALLLREPQLREAEALLDAAKARKRKAALDLARTRITAPFDCRVLATQVEVGQFVSAGTLLGRIYGVEHAEVRVPVSDDDLALLDLPPLRWREDPRAPERSAAKQKSSSSVGNGVGSEMRDAPGRIESNGSRPHDPASAEANAGGLARSDDVGAFGPQATLRARYAGLEVAWTGTVVRTEAEIDPRTRMTHLVVRVSDPFSFAESSWPAPLSPGRFVRVELAGRTLEDVIVLPRHALRDEDRVAVVDPSSRLRLRRVEVLRRERDIVVVALRSREEVAALDDAVGLDPGERVVVSPLAAVVDGMEVEVELVGRDGENAMDTSAGHGTSRPSVRATPREEGGS